jgi:hypothetical protein
MIRPASVILSTSLVTVSLCQEPASVTLGLATASIWLSRLTVSAMFLVYVLVLAAALTQCVYSCHSVRYQDSVVAVAAHR